MEKCKKIVRTVKDLIDLAPISVDSVWSIKSFDVGIVRFKYENGRFFFTGTKRLADTEISETSYNMIVEHFMECKAVGTV